MRSMEMNENEWKKTHTQTHRWMKYQTYLHTNEFERIAGMIMPLPYMFVASLKSNETNINYATKHILLTKATFQKQFDRAQKKNVEN